jgi:hypothetical protein
MDEIQSSGRAEPSPSGRAQPSRIPAWHRNLKRRPATPAAGRGYVQVQLARCFAALGPEIITSDAFRWCARWQAPPRGRVGRYSVWRRLREMADPVRKVPPHNAWLWRLRERNTDAT